MNVALVVLDTLRYDAFEEYFDWLPGLRFQQAWAPANWTVPVHASMFTGEYPSEIGVHAKHKTLDCSQATLAELLSNAGYRTRAFSANVNISPLFEYDRGFDEFRLSRDLRYIDQNVFDWGNFIAASQTEGPSRYIRALLEILRSDVDTLPSLRRGLDIKFRDLGVADVPPDDGAKEALSFIQSADFRDDEFLFVNLMEAHAPYDPPKEYWTAETEFADRDWTTYNGLLATMVGEPPGPATGSLLEDSYLDSVRYLSDVYRDIFHSLRKSFDVVITVGDHGELFGEYDAWQHAHGLCPELTNVPCIISGDHVEDKRTDAVVSLVDIFDTILEQARVSNTRADRPLVTDDGSLKQPNPHVYTEYLGINEQNKQKVESHGYETDPYDEPLFGIAVGPDRYGYQTVEGFTVTNSGDAELEAMVLEYAESRPTLSDETETEISAEVRSHLEDLGYA